MVALLKQWPRFSNSGGAYFCACSRDPGEKCGFARISHQAELYADKELVSLTKNEWSKYSVFFNHAYHGSG